MIQPTEELVEQREHQLTNVGDISPGAQSAIARDAYDQTPIGTVPLAYDVRAIYDSRPINAYDFNIPVSASGELTNPITISFTVPNGYVCVLKRVITFIEDPIPSPAKRSDVLLTLLLNQGVVPNNENIPIGVEQDSLVNCFVIADQGSVLSARLTVSAAVLAGSSTYWVQFYGQFLQKTNIPASFEIANPTNRASSAPPLPITPPLVSAPVVSRPPDALPVSHGPAIPPYDVTWGYVIGQSPRVYTPMAKIGNSKRVMSSAEQFQYREYLDAIRPRS